MSTISDFDKKKEHSKVTNKMNVKTAKQITKVKNFSCAKCNKSFATKFSMQRHSADCGVAQNRVTCERCNKSLKNIDILEKHQVVCYGLAKKVACGYCDELFCSPFSLRRHLWRFHQDEPLPTQTTKVHTPGSSHDMENSFTYGTDKTKKDSEAKSKKILNFTLAKPATEESCNFRYCLDVCYDYEYLEDEIELEKYEKPVVYPLTNVKKESQSAFHRKS